MTEQQAKKLGELIRSAREAKGLSLRALETATGLARTWLVYLEAGRSLEPLPANGSSTNPPGGAVSLTSQRMRSSGLTVG